MFDTFDEYNFLFLICVASIFYKTSTVGRTVVIAGSNT